MEELKALSIYDLMLGNMVYGIYVDEDTQQTSFYICKIVGLDSSGLAEYSIMVESEDKFDEYQYDWFEGIPLNHDEFIKLGFKTTYFGNYEKDKVWIYKDDELGYVNQTGLQIHFVHELQNYYKWLTGKELTYNEK